MLHKSLSISLGTTFTVGAAGFFAAYLSGGFTDTSPMKRVVWKNKPTSIPTINRIGDIENEAEKKLWEAKQAKFISKTSSGPDHPWWKELFKDAGTDKLNIPVLIAKWCMNNNDTTIDVTSTRGEMLEALCDVSLY